MAVKYGQLAIPDVATFKSANNIASTDSNGKLVLSQSPLSAGENITISDQGVISATVSGQAYTLIKETIDNTAKSADIAINTAFAEVNGDSSQSIRLITAETVKGTISLSASSRSLGPSLELKSDNGVNTFDLIAGNPSDITFNIHTKDPNNSNRYSTIGEYSDNTSTNKPEKWSLIDGRTFNAQGSFTTNVIDTYSSNLESESIIQTFEAKHSYESSSFSTTDIFRTDNSDYRSLSLARLNLKYPSIKFDTNSSIDINNYDSRLLCYKGKGYGTQPNVMKVHGYYVARIFGRTELGATVPYGSSNALPHAARLYLAYSLPVTDDNSIDINKIWNSNTADLPTDLVPSDKLAQFAIQDPKNTWFSFYSDYHYPYCFSINNTEGNAYIDVNVNESLLERLYDSNSEFPEPFKKPSKALSYYAWRMACFPANPEFDVYKRVVDLKSIEFTINSFSLGYNNQSTGFISFAFGKNNKVIDSFSGTMGIENTVAGYGSFCLGTGNTITGESSNVNGNRNTIKGASLYAIGIKNSLTGLPIVSSSTAKTLGGSVAIGVGNNISFSGNSGRGNYGQSYCLGTMLSSTKPNQLILGWANEEVEGSSDTNHQIIFGLGDFDGTTATRRNAMVIDSKGILVPNSSITVGTCINISAGSNGCISLGPINSNKIYKTCVAIGENNIAENTPNLSYRLLVGDGNTTNGQNTACLGKYLTTSGNHQTVVGVNNSAVSGYGLIVGTGDPNNKTKPCNGLQVSAEGIKVPVYSMGSDANAYPIGYDTGNVEYKLIRVCKDSNGAYSLEIV